MEDLKGPQGKGIELVDDESSTDSGCSSGGSTGSAELLYVERSRGRSSSGQEMLRHSRSKSSRSWSPGEKTAYRLGSSSKSSSHSPSGSEEPGPDPGASLKRISTVYAIRKLLQSLRISERLELPKSRDSAAKRAKGQKRILRSPVSYTYVKGLSGLPTQRIPRNAV